MCDFDLFSLFIFVHRRSIVSVKPWDKTLCWIQINLQFDTVPNYGNLLTDKIVELTDVF